MQSSKDAINCKKTDHRRPRKVYGKIGAHPSIDSSDKDPNGKYEVNIGEINFLSHHEKKSQIKNDKDNDRTKIKPSSDGIDFLLLPKYRRPNGSATATLVE